MLLDRVNLKYCTEEAGKEAFACARTPRLRLRLRYLLIYLPVKCKHPGKIVWDYVVGVIFMIRSSPCCIYIKMKNTCHLLDNDTHVWHTTPYDTNVYSSHFLWVICWSVGNQGVLINQLNGAFFGAVGDGGSSSAVLVWLKKNAR